MLNYYVSIARTAEIKPQQQGGDRRSKLKGEQEELLKNIVKENNELYLREIREEIFSKTGIKVSTSSLCRQLKKLKLERKKKSNSHRTKKYKN